LKSGGFFLLCKNVFGKYISETLAEFEANFQTFPKGKKSFLQMRL
jgi:hypothetical protein